MPLEELAGQAAEVDADELPGLIESQRAQRVAKKYAGNLRSVCKEVVQKKGARARG